MGTLNLNCITRFRDKSGKITGYRVSNANGNIKDVTAEDLKNALRSGNVLVMNLRLTTDGRIIPTVSYSDSSNSGCNGNSKESNAKLVNFEAARNKYESDNLLRAFKLAYLKSGTDARIYIFSSGGRKNGDFEVRIGFKRVVSSSNKGIFGTISSIVNQPDGLVVIKLIDHRDFEEGELGKYEVTTPWGAWDTDYIDGVEEILEKQLSTIGSHRVASSRGKEVKQALHGNCDMYNDFMHSKLGAKVKPASVELHSIKKDKLTTLMRVERLDSASFESSDASSSYFDAKTIDGMVIYNIGDNTILLGIVDSNIEEIRVPPIITVVSLAAFRNCNKLHKITATTPTNYKCIQGIIKRGLVPEGVKLEYEG